MYNWRVVCLCYKINQKVFKHGNRLPYYNNLIGKGTPIINLFIDHKIVEDDSGLSSGLSSKKIKTKEKRIDGRNNGVLEAS